MAMGCRAAPAEGLRARKRLRRSAATLRLKTPQVALHWTQCICGQQYLVPELNKELFYCVEGDSVHQ